MYLIPKKSPSETTMGGSEGQELFFNTADANKLSTRTPTAVERIGYTQGVDNVVQTDTVDDTNCAQGATLDRTIPLPNRTGKWTVMIEGQIAGTGASNADFYIRKNGVNQTEFQYLNAAASSGSFSISADVSIENLETDVFEFRNDNDPGDAGSVSTKNAKVRWFKRP